nr:MAG TPA: hypothetical protein [Caudoviricetes sp.]
MVADGGGEGRASSLPVASALRRPSAAGSNPAAGSWPDRQRRPHPRPSVLLGMRERWARTFLRHGVQRSGRINTHNQIQRRIPWMRFCRIGVSVRTHRTCRRWTRA